MLSWKQWNCETGSSVYFSWWGPYNWRIVALCSAGLTPAWFSESRSSALDFKRLRIIRSITLLGSWSGLLFYNPGITWNYLSLVGSIIRDWVHSFSHFCSQITLIRWHWAVRAFPISSPPFFTRLEGTLSTARFIYDIIIYLIRTKSKLKHEEFTFIKRWEANKMM